MTRDFLKLASWVLVLLAGSASSTGSANGDITKLDRVRVLTEAKTIKDIELTDQDGEPFRFSSLEGNVVMVFFGFTNCPDVCPMTMANARALWKTEGFDKNGVEFVLVSVDGDRDTPAVMKEFLRQYSPEFVGVTGDPATVKRLAKDFAAAFFKGHVEQHGGYSVMHSPQVFVLDRSGQLRAELYDAPIDTVRQVISAL